MNLAILHYHLNRGGVTQVIAGHLRALATAVDRVGQYRVAVIFGGRQEGWPAELVSDLDSFDVPLCAVPGLDYDDSTRAEPSALADQLRAVLRKIGFYPDETILHIHNHNLGKNVSLPGAVIRLAEDGYGLLLQPHDFPEDFRPDNYRRLISAIVPEAPLDLPAVLYPQSANIHYAVLNRRDRAILQRSGVHRSHLHLLPNPVAEIGSLPPQSESRAKLRERFAVPLDHRFVLYPVRGIRRKNLGEALLWSALADDKTTFGFTLPPLNPLEQPGYLMWKELAETLKLPCVFEVGGPKGLKLDENMAAADMILTTSVAEGFGMVFLESCLIERRLIGRDLPEITSDFHSAGVRLGGLRPALHVPIVWVGEGAFGQSISEAYCEAAAAYGLPAPPRDKLRRDVEGLVREGLVDFGVLDARHQRQIIRSLRSKAMHRDRLRETNGWIGQALSPDAAEDSPALERNAEVVRSKYCLQKCGRTLHGIYRAVAASRRDGSPRPPAQGRRIIEGFLDLSRFHPIRTETTEV